MDLQPDEVPKLLQDAVGLTIIDDDGQTTDFGVGCLVLTAQ
jgi:hypothetical protein